jgi:hypothetical protein
MLYPTNSPHNFQPRRFLFLRIFLTKDMHIIRIFLTKDMHIIRIFLTKDMHIIRIFLTKDMHIIRGYNIWIYVKFHKNGQSSTACNFMKTKENKNINTMCIFGRSTKIL